MIIHSNSASKTSSESLNRSDYSSVLNKTLKIEIDEHKNDVRVSFEILGVSFSIIFNMSIVGWLFKLKKRIDNIARTIETNFQLENVSRSNFMDRDNQLISFEEEKSKNVGSSKPKSDLNQIQNIKSEKKGATKFSLIPLSLRRSDRPGKFEGSYKHQL